MHASNAIQPLPARRLGPDASRHPLVSVLGFGGAPIGFLETEQREVERLIGSLLDRGLNLLDTAAMYRGSEEAIGRAIRGRRGDAVVVSKCGNPPGREGLDPWSAESIRLSIERSLKRLAIDHLDAILLHTCDLATLEKGEAIEAVVQAKRDGLVRSVGYSGDNEAAAWAASHPEIELLQLSLNLADQRNIDLVLPRAAARGLGVMVKRPLANAAWRPRSERAGIYADYGQPYEDRLKAMALDPSALGIEGPADRAWPELALRFVLSFPQVTSAIVGSTNPARVEQNAAAAAKGPLPAAAIEAIRRAFATASSGGGSWEALG
jgi:aryl-alcohol dehydrogenase-like predicted oxidoreductase